MLSDATGKLPLACTSCVHFIHVRLIPSARELARSTRHAEVVANCLRTSLQHDLCVEGMCEWHGVCTGHRSSGTHSLPRAALLAAWRFVRDAAAKKHPPETPMRAERRSSWRGATHGASSDNMTRYTNRCVCERPCSTGSALPSTPSWLSCSANKLDCIPSPETAVLSSAVSVGILTADENTMWPCSVHTRLHDKMVNPALDMSRRQHIPAGYTTLPAAPLPNCVTRAGELPRQYDRA